MAKASIIRGIAAIVFGILSLQCIAAQMEISWIDGVPYTVREDNGMRYAAVSLPEDQWPNEHKDMYDCYQYPLDETRKLTIPATVMIDGTEYSVEVIENNSLNHQRDMLALSLPPTIRRVGTPNLRNFPNIKEIDLGGTREFMTTDRYFHSDQVLENMPALERLEYSGDIKYVKNSFNNLGLREFEFPAWVEIYQEEWEWPVQRNFDLIEENNFNSWPNIKKIDLRHLNFIRSMSFRTMPEVEELTMPETLVLLTGGIMGNYPKLKKLRLPREIQGSHKVYFDFMYNAPSLEEIYSPSREVPRLEYVDVECAPTPDQTFGMGSVDYENCVVYVPEGCAEAYRVHENWKKFKNIVEYDFVNDIPLGIPALGSEEMLKEEYYDMSGRRIPDIENYTGIYVCRRSASSETKSTVRIR